MISRSPALRAGRVGVVAALAVLTSLMLEIPEAPASHPFVSTTPAQYQACGRVFPDPHAYWPAPAPPDGVSPFAKGNVACRPDDFLTYDLSTNSMVGGMEFLETLFPEFIEFQKLEEDFGTGEDCATTGEPFALCSAGLNQAGANRERKDLYMVRVTDERSAAASSGNVPLEDKEQFAFPLSIHGIERAGAEAGTRAAEDLATWGYCEALAAGETVATPPAAVNCAQEGTAPYPLLETQPESSVSAGQALKQSVIYFVYANPDGWRRGDPDNISRSFQRYNGNGVDLNRDWPTIGYTFRPYTPWSEPETRGFGQVLKGISDEWTGGIDLHGQLIDRAFSFTLMGASQRDYAKDQRILQTVKGAWEDAEARFEWADAYIKPNDAPGQCSGGAQPPDCDERMYGIQWGTVWDTIDYTVTGAFGDWIDSPLGLGADGIDNEMSLSHLSNCGTGTCYLPDFEQLHVDGNKSLVYSMVNFSLLPEDQTFEVAGPKVGYVFSPKRLRETGGTTPPPTDGLEPQDDIQATLDPTNGFSYEFEVKGPLSDPPAYNGGVVGTATPAGNVGGIGGSSVLSLVLERKKPDEPDPDPGPGDPCGEPGGEWQEVNRYFNQSPVYAQSGQAVHANSPEPGAWRVCVTGSDLEQIALSGGFWNLDVSFVEEQAIFLPPGGQAPYSASNMDFFSELAPYSSAQLVRLNANRILSGQVDLDNFASVVISDDAFPGYVEEQPTGPAQPPITFDNPGAGTVPCAGGQDAPPTCRTDHEFDVDGSFNNQSMTATLVDPVGDWDIFVQKQAPDGSWTTVGQGTSGALDGEQATLLDPIPGHYRVRVVNWGGVAPADRLDIVFSNDAGGTPGVNTRSPQEIATWKGRLLDYVQGGGNLVLTDGAILNLDLMDLFPREAISSFSVYAGYIGFTADGGNTSTYDDPLAQDVNQPGAAEGDGHRHQTYEPVPIGFAIQDEGGNDFNSAPVWAVSQSAWEGASGRTVGTTTDEQVTLGELEIGAGQVRIIGALLPMPTDAYYHPFGLADYALTYSGFQVLNNALRESDPTPEEPTLTVTIQGDGQGFVHSDPRGISCGTAPRQNNCSETYPPGTEVSLIANQQGRNDDFVGWGGDCSGSQPSCTLVMDGDKNVTATFEG